MPSCDGMKMSKLSSLCLENRRHADQAFPLHISKYLLFISSFFSDQFSSFYGWYYNMSLLGTRDTQLTISLLLILRIGRCWYRCWRSLITRLICWWQSNKWHHYCRFHAQLHTLSFHLPLWAAFYHKISDSLTSFLKHRYILIYHIYLICMFQNIY